MWSAKKHFLKEFPEILQAALMNCQFGSVQSLSRVQLFVTPWTAAHQASLSITWSDCLNPLKSGQREYVRFTQRL